MEFRDVVRKRRMVRNFTAEPVDPAAVNEGLSAGYAGVIDHAGLRSLLGIPDEVTAVGVIPIGHSAPDKPSGSLKRGRRDIGQIIHREQW